MAELGIKGIFVGETLKAGCESNMLPEPFKASALMPDLVFRAVRLLIQSLVNVSQGDQ